MTLAGRVRVVTHVPRLRIRTRVALWCALLVTASGAVVLLGAVTITQRTLAQNAPKPALTGYSTDPVVLRSQQFALIEANRVLVEDTTGQVRDLGLVGLVGLAVVSLAVGWLVAGRMLAPASRLANTARTMSAADLSHRVGATGPDDELKTLADAFDGMLDRLDRSFHRQRRFVADASHELRTPLASLRAQVDVALDGHLDEAQLRQQLTEIGTVLDRGTALVNAMLALSRAETLARRDIVSLDELTAEILTSTPGIDRLDLQCRLSAAHVVGDPVLIEQVVQNLIRNAVAYNTTGGRLIVVVSSSDGDAVVHVENDGPVIPADDVEALFARFHRGRSSQGRPGFGLGLSIVAAIVEAHGAAIEARARPAGGLDITVRFAGVSS